MNATFSDEFKKIFLMKFTAELIKNSGKVEIKKLEEIIRTKKGAPIFLPERKIITLEKIPAQRIFKRPPQKIVPFQPAKPTLLIPEPKLPEHLTYLKPTPTPGPEIDLGKLNPLIKDNAVKTIEVNPNEKVVVTGAMGTKPTSITLSKEEIDKIIDVFSKTSKIPVEEGIYRVVVGNLILSAIISEVIGSKFMIKKMPAPPKPQVPAPIIPQKVPPNFNPQGNPQKSI